MQATLRRLAASPLTGFIIVTLLYISSLRGLYRVEKLLFADNPEPIRVLEYGVTLLYTAALLFTTYLWRKTKQQKHTTTK